MNLVAVSEQELLDVEGGLCDTGNIVYDFFCRRGARRGKREAERDNLRDAAPSYRRGPTHFTR